MTLGCSGGGGSTPSPAPQTPSISISISSSSKVEGSTFTFNLTRTGDLSSSSSVNYAVTGGATASDFVGAALPSGSVSFAANASAATITITTIDDAFSEATETFTVTLSAPTNATITTATASATITDNDSTAAKPMKIVVLGASTAAGKNIWKLFSGTTAADEPTYANRYGWVATYGVYLDTINASNNVVNLALSGYSTTRALSDGPADASYQHSLAFAIAQHSNADAFIFNFPAIRGEEGETVADVISNLTQMRNQAIGAGVRQVWITTGQPTENATDCFVISTSGACHATLTIHQTRMDLTNQVMAAFPGRYVDFYRPLSVNGSLNQIAAPALLNAVDLIHPNVEGHAALKNAVISAQIYEALQ